MELSWRVKQEQPLSGTRGVSSFDYNGFIVFVQSSVEGVAHNLSNNKNAKRQRDIIDKEVTIIDKSFFVFRLSGHEWTNIIAVAGDISVYHLTEEDACLLSEQLKTRTIYYGISDCACAVEYRIYENGNLLETLSTYESYEISMWKSLIHDVCKISIQEDIEKWLDCLFREFNVLEGGAMFTYWLDTVLYEKGHTVINRDPDSIIERCDFITLEHSRALVYQEVPPF
jgi:hypothetical protein